MCGRPRQNPHCDRGARPRWGLCGTAALATALGMSLGCSHGSETTTGAPSRDERGLDGSTSLTDAQVGANDSAAASDGGVLPRPEEESDSGVDAGRASAPCQAPTGIDSSPETISELLDLINSLPRPASMGCFLESLARPLYAYATFSQLSAQPADGPENPRTFLFLGDSLIISVVPAGIGVDNLEYSFLTDSVSRSVKGEVHFPIEEELTTDAIVARLARDFGSMCFFCHFDEVPAGQEFYDGAVESNALRPSKISEVNLDALRLESALCDARSTPKRCSILQGLFGHGEVIFRPFPEEMPTFLGSD